LADNQRLSKIYRAPDMAVRRFGMISSASVAKIIDLENVSRETFDLIEGSVDFSDYQLPKDPNYDPNSVLDDAVLKPFIRDYAEYAEKGRLELSNINARAIGYELCNLKPPGPLGQEFPSWLSLIELFVWAFDSEARAWERFCERVNATRQSKMSGTFP
jgi:hypothetical protein